MWQGGSQRVPKRKIFFNLMDGGGSVTPGHFPKCCRFSHTMCEGKKRPFSEKFSILEPVCFPHPMMAPKTNKVQPGPWSWRLWRKNQQIQKLEEKIPKCNENGEKHCQLSQYLLPNYLNISLILRVWTELMFFFFSLHFLQLFSSANQDVSKHLHHPFEKLDRFLFHHPPHKMK